MYSLRKRLMIKFNRYKINLCLCLTAPFQRSLLEFLQETLLLCHLSPLVKHLLNERRKLLRRDRSSMAIQTLIDKINALIRRNLAVKNRINDKDIGSKSWWSIVNSITGWKSTHLSISSIVNPDEINDYFCTINTDPDYIHPGIRSIPDGTRIPEVTSLTFCNFLLKLKRTTAGPDQLLFWLWRNFAFDPAPIICHVFNCLLRCQTAPTLWKNG